MTTDEASLVRYDLVLPSSELHSIKCSAIAHFVSVLVNGLEFSVGNSNKKLLCIFQKFCMT